MWNRASVGMSYSYDLFIVTEVNRMIGGIMRNTFHSRKPKYDSHWLNEGDNSLKILYETRHHMMAKTIS